MDYQAVLKTLAEYFCDLIIIQYKASEQNRALIYLLTQVIFGNMLIKQVEDLCVNVDNSEGVQLDVVGAWVGIDRFFQGRENFTHPYFSMPNYRTIKNNEYLPFTGGFSTYENFSSVLGGFLMYQDDIDVKTTFSKLPDELYRPLIKLKIIKNSIKKTNKSIDEAIYNWSGGEVYTTWGTMKLTFNYAPNFQQIMELALQKNILPAPNGVALILREVEE